MARPTCKRSGCSGAASVRLHPSLRVHVQPSRAGRGAASQALPYHPPPAAAPSGTAALPLLLLRRAHLALGGQLAGGADGVKVGVLEQHARARALLPGADAEVDEVCQLLVVHLLQPRGAHALRPQRRRRRPVSSRPPTFDNHRDIPVAPPGCYKQLSLRAGLPGCAPGAPTETTCSHPRPAGSWPLN